MNEEKIDNEFRTLIEEISDDIFWEYIRSWKDEQDLIDQMLEWDTQTKAEAIKEIKKMLKNEKR